MIAESLPQRAELAERLQLYSRYVALVAEQLDALGRDDRGRLKELVEERGRLEAGLAHAPGEPIGDAMSIEDLLGAGLASLAERIDAIRRMEDRWSLLNDGAVRSARTVAPPTVRGGRYPEPAPHDRQVDRRL
jgi:hypothetical protein